MEYAPKSIEEQKYHQHLIEELKKVPDLSFVASVNDRVVGYVQAELPGDNAVLEDIAVNREYQGKGVGTRLLQEALSTLKQKGGKTLRAEVHYKCSPAIPFYYKHGFRIVSFKQDHFGKSHDAIILRKIL